jgi:hypothetical protein
MFEEDFQDLNYYFHKLEQNLRERFMLCKIILVVPKSGLNPGAI